MALDKRHRMHEAYGASVLPFALWQHCQTAKQNSAWVCGNKTMFNPQAVTDYTTPNAFTFITSEKHVDRLWSAEELLRSGVLGLVVCEMIKPATFTEGRRLQLAAEEGGTTMLCINPNEAGCNAAETRWHCTPISTSAESDSTHWLWTCKKNKSGTIGGFQVKYHAASRTFSLVTGAANQPIGP